MQRFIAVILLAAATAGAAAPGFFVPAPADTQETLYCSGSGESIMNIYEGVTNYYDWPGNLYYGYSYEMVPPTMSRWHGYASFDLSSIPDTGLILAAEYGFYQYEEYLGPPNVCLKAYDFPGGTPQQHYEAIVDGQQSTGFGPTVNGWNVSMLNDSGVAAIQSRLATDAVNIAVYYNGLRGSFSAYGDTGPHRPYLKLEYDLVGIAAPGRRVSSPGWVDVMPNPARGTVTLKASGVQGSGARVRIFDAAGREVLSRSFDICHSSLGLGHWSFPLDCSGLSSGVYLLRLDADGRSATRRLAVVGR